MDVTEGGCCDSEGFTDGDSLIVLDERVVELARRMEAVNVIVDDNERLEAAKVLVAELG